MSTADQPTSSSYRAVLDTSIFIAAESERPLRTDLLPDEAVSTVITLAQLNAGVLAAADSSSRSRRLKTLTALASMELLEVDVRAAELWAQMRVFLAERRRRINVNDLWIASIAVAHRLPIATQDNDLTPLTAFPGLSIIKV